MTDMIKKHGAIMFLAGFLAGSMVFAVLAFKSGNDIPTEPREIVLISKNVTFYKEGHLEEANPTLVLRKGEPVKLVLRNDDPDTLLHCFVIPGLNVKTTQSLAGGESETLLFTPEERGGFVYACLLHPAMAGKLVVE